MKIDHRSWHVLGGMVLTLLLAAQSVVSANSVVWEADKSLIDTTDYTGLGPFYWFANFGNTNAVTGAPMNQMEARKLPKWIHWETDPAFIGKDDSGAIDDDTNRTGFSFSENTTLGTGATSIGGQTLFNMLTLPDGTSGLSGQAVDSLSVTGNTSSMANFRILDGAPSAFRIWVVLDNGTGPNFQTQSRFRVNLRGTDGPPLFGNDIDQQEGEALPNGQRLGNDPNPPTTQNGIADAWAFFVSDVSLHDIVTLRPTSAAGIPGSLPGFAGFIITPEPSSVGLAVLGAVVGFGSVLLRRRRA